ncbi:MAG: hypothetical protein CMP23_17830 [Rickettsiales bacterium]|nr:hypothetical protein [Rickettsiales bacterium]|tara:strand:+ start:1361 stop:2011 length:651 start_codon:yes stop_codon:yes gene_type:complete
MQRSLIRSASFALFLTSVALLITPSLSSAHEPGTKPTLPQLTAKEEARLAKGKLVLRTERGESDGSGLITGVIEIEATADKVWSLLSRFELVPEASKAVKGVHRYDDGTQMGKQAGSVGIEYTVKVAWVTIKYSIHHDLQPAQHYLHWTLDKNRENDILKTDGSYSVWPGASPGKVRFLYITEVDTGRNIPDWIEEELTESSLKRFLVFVKKRAES